MKSYTNSLLSPSISLFVNHLGKTYDFPKQASHRQRFAVPLRHVYYLHKRYQLYATVPGYCLDELMPELFWSTPPWPLTWKAFLTHAFPHSSKFTALKKISVPYPQSWTAAEWQSMSWGSQLFHLPLERAKTNVEEMQADSTNSSMLIKAPANATFTVHFLITDIWEHFAGVNHMPLSW